MQQTFFDSYATTYDDHFTNSFIGRAQRALVHQYLLTLKNNNASVLEINCGTGEDALFLAKHFNNVLCSDASSKMIEVASIKNQKNENCSFKQSTIQHIKNNTNQKFDFVFSNFGGLNCISPLEMKQFAADMSAVGNTDLVFVIMGRKCLWERFVFWKQNDTINKGRRKKIDGVEAELDGQKFKVYYYSPVEINSIFSDYAEFKCIPIGFFIPPSFIEKAIEKRQFVFSILKGLDAIVKNIRFLSNYADHYLIHLKKV